MRKAESDPVLRVLRDLDYYKSFVAGPSHQLTQTDLQNAIALIEHLVSCHRASLNVPGISSALVKHPFVSSFDGEIELAGLHCDHAYTFVEDLLCAAQRWCAEQIEISAPGESPKAIAAPLPAPRLRAREQPRIKC